MQEKISFGQRNRIYDSKRFSCVGHSSKVYTFVFLDKSFGLNIEHPLSSREAKLTERPSSQSLPPESGL